MPSTDATLPATDPVTRLVMGNRTILGVVLLICSLAWLVPTVVYGKTILTPPATGEKKADPAKPEEADKTPIADPTRVDKMVIGFTCLLGAFATAAAAIWVMASLVPPTESARMIRAKMSILIGAAAVGFMLMLLGLVLFYLWFDSLSKWLNLGEVKEARWVLLPILVFLAGAGISFFGIQPARSEERNEELLRKFIFGTNFALTTFLLVFALLVGNIFLALRLPAKLDTTGNGFYSLSEESKKFIPKIEQRVNVYSTLPDGASGIYGRIFDDVHSLLTNCQELNPARFRVRFYSQTVNKDEIKALQARYPQFNINDYGILITVGDDEKRAAFLRAEDLFAQEGGGRMGAPSEASYTFLGESKLMREVVFLSESETKPKVYFTQSNGELEIAPPPPGGPEVVAVKGRPATVLKAYLEKNYVEVLPWRAGGKETKIPDDATAVVIADPRSPFTVEAATAIRNYVMNPRPDGKKGKLIFLTSPFPNPNQKGVSETGLEPLLAELQVTLDTSYMVGRRNSTLGFTDVVALPNPDLASTNTIASSYERIFLSDCRRVLPPPPPPPGAQPPAVKTEWLFAATRGGMPVWFEPDPPVNPQATFDLMVQDVEARKKYQLSTSGNLFPVAVAVSEGTTSRAVVIGSGTAFADPNQRKGLTAEPPVDLVMACLDWLRDRPTLNIVNKSYNGYKPNRAAEYSRLFWLPVGLVMLTIVGMGTMVWVVRRR